MSNAAIETGRLPDGWRWGRLGEMCEVIAGQSPPSSTYRTTPEGLPFFQGKADFGVVSPVARVWCVAPKKIAQPGDILISVRAPVGPTNIADVECCIGRGLAAIRCGKDASRDFILHALRHYEEALVNKGTGSTFEAINRDDLESFVIPLPPLAEQQRIAASLKKQMAAVEKARTAAHDRLEAVKALPAAFLRHVFPQSDELLPDGWQWVRLGEVETIKYEWVDLGKIILGKPQYGSGAKKVPYDGKIRYVRITDLTDQGELKYDDLVSPSKIEQDLFLQPGDLLIARSGSVGRTYLHGNLPGTFQYAGYLIRFRIDPVRALPKYIFYITQSDFWKSWILRNSKTGTLTNINAKQYSSFRLPLPSLDIQQRIVTMLKKQMAAIEEAQAKAEEELDAIDAMPSALLRKAFAGEGKLLPRA